MKTTRYLVVLAALTSCQAGVFNFVNNPTTNSTDFATLVAANGGSINGTIDFNTHPVGALQTNFYSGLGVTLAGTGDFAAIQNGAGPAQANVSSLPLSSGEGLHPVSNFVGGTITGGTLTITFASPVLGVGLFVVDLFDPPGGNTVSIQIFNGPNGTGSSLGTFSSAGDNFQQNFLYFMGAVSTGNDIRSLVFTSPGSASDIVGLDNIRFATVSAPEPATFALLGIGLFALVWKARRRRT